MWISMKDFIVLGAVVGVHLLFFILGLLQLPNPDKKEPEVLQAELISPAPAPPAVVKPPHPPPPPQTPPPKKQ